MPGEMIFLRACLAVVLSLAILLAYQYAYEKSFAGRQPPLYLGVLVVIASVALRVGFFFIGARAGAFLLYAGPPLDDIDPRVFAACGGILGLWAAAILLQIAQNAVRLSLGLPTRPLRWVGSTKRKAKSHRR